MVPSQWVYTCSDDDEEEELRRELERIKRERLEEKKRQELERLRQEQEDQDEMIMQSNPLLNSSEDSFNVKRKYGVELNTFSTLTPSDGMRIQCFEIKLGIKSKVLSVPR